MKKLGLKISMLSLATLAIALTASVAFAQDGVRPTVGAPLRKPNEIHKLATSTRIEVRKDVKELHEDIKDIRDTRRASSTGTSTWKERGEGRPEDRGMKGEDRGVKWGNGSTSSSTMREKWQEKTDKRLETREGRITNRFDGVISQLQTVYGKASTFVDNLASQGKDVTEARAKLVIASSSISTAINAVNDFTTFADNITASSTTKDTIKTFESKRKIARQAIDKAMAAIKDVIKPIRKAHNEGGNATTTATTTTTSTSTASTTSQ